MLAYIGVGSRNYYRDPVLGLPRDVWEVACVFSNDVVLRREEKEFTRLRDQLFLFPPTSPHGWKAKKDAPTERLILHFTELPNSIVEVYETTKSPFLRTEVSENQKKTLLSQVHHIGKTFLSPNNITMLKCERLALDIAILFLENSSLTKNYTNDFFIVEKVITWYKEHIIECPSISEAAAKNNISTSHLRRVFNATVGESPKQVFQKIQLKRAKNLLLTSDYSIEGISAECGFGDPSSFWRFFYNKTQSTPRKWKRQVMERKKHMRPEGYIV
ncbi:MAG: helix-turn-helix domain-containing protein [Spirochaetales bacterium]|nr:helix-turn-helix domain-containing protein [Spirochaetales bacterium]